MEGRERKTENEKNKIHICKLHLVLSRPLNVYFKSGYCKYKYSKRATETDGVKEGER